MSNASDAATSNTGEFHPSKPRSEPLTTTGHKPGVLASEADKAPEFHAQTLPAGTAPADRTFKPNNISEVTPVQDTSKEADAGGASASDTLRGATSGDVHTGYGHPGQGQTSQELHHDGGKASKDGSGLEGRASGVPSANLVDKRDPEFAGQRVIDSDEKQTGRGNLGGPAAEERVPETADSL